MNKEIIRYQREMKKHLYCGPSKRKDLLDRFHDSVSSFLEDNPEPTYGQLITAFGPPEEMAGILMVLVPKDAKINYQKRKKLAKFLTCLVAVLFITFAFYVFFDKEYSVVTSYGEVIPGNITSTQGGG